MNSGTLESSTSDGHAGDDAAMVHRPLEQPRVEARRARGTPCESFDDRAGPSPWRFTFSQRADSIGVSVKLTSSDTMIANAIVRPKLFMKRPTMPPMNADRHEDRDQRQRRREHRQADLLRRLDRGLELIVVPFSSMNR